MWAFEVLGLDEDADERAIKRAYARQLKQARPDEDPQGFQQLHEAYQHALAIARPRAFEEAADDAHDSSSAPPAQRTASPEPHDDPPPVALSGPAASPAPQDEVQTFDVDAFLQECIARLTREDAPALRAWLEAQPALWSLQLKAQLGRWLLQVLDERQPPVPATNLDEALRFFNLDHVLSGVDPWFLHHLRDRLQLRHELLPGNEYLVGRRLLPGTLEHERREIARSRVAQLRKPLRWRQALFYGLPYGRAGSMRHFALGLDNGDVDRLGEDIDLRQARFWIDAGDTMRQSPARRALALARCATVVWILGLVAIVLHALTGGMRPDTWQTEGAQALLLLAGGPVALYAAWEVWVVLAAYLRWQGAFEGMPVRAPVLRWLWVPALCAATVVLAQLPVPPSLATAMGAFAMLTAFVRLQRRAQLELGWSIFWAAVAIPLARGLILAWSMNSTAGYASAGIALALWAIDAIRHRAVLWSSARALLRRPAADSGM